MPVPGELDIVLASELMEAGRAIQRGLVTPDRTTLIASTNRVYSMTEKTAIADGRVDAAKADRGRHGGGQSFRAWRFRSHRGRCPQRDQRLAVRRAGGHRCVAISARTVRGRDSQAAAWAWNRVWPRLLPDFDAATAPAPAAIADAKAREAPRSGRALASARGANRERVSRGRAATFCLRASSGWLIIRMSQYAPTIWIGSKPFATWTRNTETAISRCSAKRRRYLALWMSYEDAIRVADLKIRRTRFERVHQECARRSGAAGADQRIPASAHRRKLRTLFPPDSDTGCSARAGCGSIVERFTRNGKIVQTTSLRGFLQLYMVAALRAVRRKSLRFEKEQKRIAEWLA